MTETDKAITAEFIVLDDPGEGFQSKNAIYTIARRLINHTAGKIIGGYETRDDGKIYPIKNAYDPGDLILQDAMYAVEYALTRGLNPYGHLHLWYQRSNRSPRPQLIVDIDYKILKGWAEWRAGFRTEVLEMDEDLRAEHNLVPEDLGAVAYNILDSEIKYFHQYQLEFIKSGIKPRVARHLAAQACAKGQGVGIVKSQEMKKSDGNPLPPPKGRTWQWRAETRALRDAIRRSHGEPPPAQIKAYITHGGQAITQYHLNLLADENFPTDLPEEDQQFYLEAGSGNFEPDISTKRATDTMRNNGDDDLDEVKSVSGGMEASTKFWKYANSHGISREDAGRYIRDANGDFDKALQTLQADQ